MVKSYLNNYKRNLSSMRRLVKKYNIPLETDELVKLENRLPYNAIANNANFEVKIENIIFNICQKLTGALPNCIDTYAVTLHHDICINPIIDIFQDDIISEYLFEIEIVGYDKDAEEYHYAWHLDRHNCDGLESLTHPNYHFQCWSDKLNHVLDDPKYGRILLMNSPRFPHPPMDLFLGIHFIINNFIDSDICKGKIKLLNDGEYQKIILQSQELMWDVYFNSYSNESMHNQFKRGRVFPLYIN